MIKEEAKENIFRRKKKKKDNSPNRTFYLDEPQKIFNAKNQLFNYSQEQQPSEPMRKTFHPNSSNKANLLSSWYGEVVHQDNYNKTSNSFSDLRASNVQQKKRRKMLSSQNLKKQKKQQKSEKKSLASYSSERKNVDRDSSTKRKSFVTVRKELLNKIMSLVPDSFDRSEEMKQSRSSKENFLFTKTSNSFYEKRKKKKRRKIIHESKSIKPSQMNYSSIGEYSSPSFHLLSEAPSFSTKKMSPTVIEK